MATKTILGGPAAPPSKLPNNDLYGKPLKGLGNPLPKVPKTPKIVPSGKRPQKVSPLK